MVRAHDAGAALSHPPEENREEKQMDETLLLLPLVGAEWKGRRVAFGDSQAQVEEIFGPANAVKNSWYYFDNRLRFDFDAEGKVEFIECGGSEGGLKPLIYGAHVFETDAGALLELLEQENAGDVDDSEAGYCYAFRDISVGVYRETTPEDVEEMIASMRAVKDNVTALVSGEIAETVAAERRRASRWESIGIGRPNYYR